MNNIVESLLAGNNYPEEGKVKFTSSDHVRFQNGLDVSGHNPGAHRRFVIEKNISGDEGYTVTMYNLDGIHPLWQNNVQMAPKQMRVVAVEDNMVHLRGFGFDLMGSPFSDYGLIVLIENGEISRAQLNMFDRNVCIVYM